MASEKIKLTYFNIMGLGETIRYMLSYLNRDFEDFRVYDYSEWQTKIKQTMPFGKLPLLEMGDKKLHQTIAICRYLGKQAKLYGDNDWEALQIDIAIDTLSDFRSGIWVYFYQRDPAIKEKFKEPLMSTTVPFYLEKFDNQIKENGGYLANGKLSWADIYFVAILEYFGFMIKQDIPGKYTNIKELQTKVQNLPGIKQWLEKRPKTDW